MPVSCLLTGLGARRAATSVGTGSNLRASLTAVWPEIGKMQKNFKSFFRNLAPEGIRAKIQGHYHHHGQRPVRLSACGPTPPRWSKHDFLAPSWNSCGLILDGSLLTCASYLKNEHADFEISASKVSLRKSSILPSKFANFSNVVERQTNNFFLLLFVAGLFSTYSEERYTRLDYEF